MGQSILDFRGTLTLYPRWPYTRVPVALCRTFPNAAVTSGFCLITILVSMRWCPVTTVGVQHLLS